MEGIKQIVAKNLHELRKARGFTQAELASKLNYSDKSVSKWENGESLPDIEVLCSIAELYGVSLDELTKEGICAEVKEEKKVDRALSYKILINALMVTAVWFIATLVYVYVKLNTGYTYWMTFCWATPLSVLVMMAMNRRFGWKKKAIIYWLLSIFTWTSLMCICLQFTTYNVWPILIIGIPIQVAIVLLHQIRKQQ